MSRFSVLRRHPIAGRLDIKSAGAEEFELRSLVETPDAAARNFVVRGVTIAYSLALTDFKDGKAANLTAGAKVEARG